MCRLLGSVSNVPRTVDEVLGDGRAAFLELARQHGDGWGYAWSSEDPVQVRKAPDSALRSAELAELARAQPARAALTHLRWATLGLEVTPVNTHPFTDGTVAFAHNGSIAPPDSLDVLIAPELQDRREGDTDSERYFLALLSRLVDQDPAGALQGVVGDIVALDDQTRGARVHSLNCMLLTPDSLYAVCSYDPGSIDDPDYYPLLYRQEGGSVVVASTGWTDSAGWQSVSNGQLLVVDRVTLQTRLLPVAVPARRGG